MSKSIKEINLKREQINKNMLLESHVSIFEYKNLPETVNPFFLELYLQTQGVVVWLKDNADIIAIEGTTAGDLDIYGVGRDVIATTRNGKEFRRVRDLDCVIGYNNLTRTPCGDIFTDAETLTEIQKSLEFLIFWTRLTSIIRVADDRTKSRVESAFKNMQAGIPVTITSKKILEDFGIPDDISIDLLTHPDFADKIQYTSKLYDDVLRWHFTRYGHATNGNGKAAQQTVDEVDSTVSQSMILPLSMLRARRDMIERVNKMFATDISVEFSGAWRAEVTAYETQTGEQSIDNSADDMPQIGKDMQDVALDIVGNSKREEVLNNDNI